MTNIQTLSSKVANAHQRIDSLVAGGAGGDVLLVGEATPATPASANSILFANSVSGIPSIVSHSGMVGRLPQTQSNISTFTNSTTGFQNMTAAWPIPANDAQVATCYRLKTWGVVTNGTVGGNLGYQINGFGLNEALVQWAAATLGTSLNAVWEAECNMVVVTTGSSGTARFYTKVTLTANSASITATSSLTGFGMSSVAIAIDTTAATTFSLTATWAAGNAPFVSGVASTFERLGA
jgi:hypothetical protein